MLKKTNKTVNSTLLGPHHQNFRYGLKQFHEFGEAVVAELALAPEMVMIGGDEFIEGHPAVGLVTEEVDHLFGKLLCSLYFLSCSICRKHLRTF